MLSPQQQAIDLIQKSKNILIALPESLNGDSLGSALALEATLKKLGKKTEVAAQESAPDKLSFLPGINILKNKLSSLRDFVISVDTSQNKISRLRYETANNVLKIFLATPQKIEQRDIKLEPGPFYYDLIITLDAPDLESLGQIFNESTELFFGKPILNIDHKSGNEYIGEVNLVEPTAASCAEITAGLIETLGSNLVDANMATLLLTGLIVKTHSFQNSKTTPQALNLASLLIVKGAEQETIIKNLYKTKPLNCLKLWGRLLGRLEFDEQRKIIWISAEREDFIATGTSAKDLNFVLDETYDLFPVINLAIILWLDENGTIGVLAQGKRTEQLQKISMEIGGSIKNSRLLVKTSGPTIKDAKDRLAVLLTSLE